MTVEHLKSRLDGQPAGESHAWGRCKADRAAGRGELEVWVKAVEAAIKSANDSKMCINNAFKIQKCLCG